MTKKQRISLAEDAYFKKILGFLQEEVKTTEEYDSKNNLTKQKVERTKKYVAPDSDALLKYLKANAPERWGEKQSSSDSDTSGVVLLPEVTELE